MQIVIDVPTSTYESIKKTINSGDPLGYFERVIVRGTPLPKGHGRLIDADKLFTDIEWHDIEDAPTIIEADMRGE